MNKIDSHIQLLLSNRKYMTQIVSIGGKGDGGGGINGANKNGPYELNGRIVFAVRSREIASQIGIIRDTTTTFTSKSSSSPSLVYYVEPKQIIKLGDELLSVRDEMNIVKNQILNHFRSVITRAASSIDKGLDIVARIDVIFARAAFGVVLDGSVPYVGSNDGNDGEDRETENRKGGVIKVKNFIHPVLAMNKEKNEVVPIDLLISNKSNERSLIISGPNAGT